MTTKTALKIEKAFPYVMSGMAAFLVYGASRFYRNLCLGLGEDAGTDETLRVLKKTDEKAWENLLNDASYKRCFD